MARLEMLSGNRSGTLYHRAPATFWILVVTAAMFVADAILSSTVSFGLKNVLALSRGDLLVNWGLYQPFTYMFLHADGFHLLFNLFVVWFAARDLEELFGARRLVTYYLLGGALGGLLHTAFSAAPVVGASGAVFALLLAYAVSWPNREVLAFFVIPVKIKYYVAILAAMEFLLSMKPNGDMVAHWAHLGGLAGGALVLAFFRRDRVFEGLAEINHKRRMARHKALIERRIRDKERVDELLDKISQTGMDSLSRGEKKFLDRMSGEFGSQPTEH